MLARSSSGVSPKQFATFGELLKFLRRRAGLTQRDLSIAVGYSSSQISRLEQNERPPDAASLAACFVPALQLEPEWAARLLELAAISRAAVQPPGTIPITPAPTPPHNLPSQLTTFIGREDAIAEGRRLLGSARLMTLTGAGGSGKSRLALEIATRVLGDFPDGVWLVQLAPLADPTLVPRAIAAVLGVPEQPGRPILDTLQAYLRARTTLLVLDNCEHLITACAQCAQDLIEACPNLRLLATSREALDVAGELILEVPPLAAPADHHALPIDVLAGYEAVQLFVDRAGAALPGFALTASNALAVTQVCRALDGMPLAIEMAAARVKLLQVEQITERLNDRFQLLTDGRRTALPRHQTLAAVMDWSYDLLSEPERTLLRRLAVFAGGWTLEAAEAVCSDMDEGRTTPQLLVGADVKDEIKSNGSIHSSGEVFTRAHDAGAPVIHPSDVLDLLTGLVNKSLVVVLRQSGQETRYACLETIRQYALAKLTASDDAAVTRRRHARYFSSLAETIQPRLWTGEEPRWLDRISAELDNFRAAVAWCYSAVGDVEEGLRLASALWLFWETRGPIPEGRTWLEMGLVRADAVSRPVRIKAVIRAGELAQAAGDFLAAAKHFEAGLRTSRTTGDPLGEAWCLWGLGYVAWQHRDDDTAHALASESLAIFRKSGDDFGMAYVLYLLGIVDRARGDLEAAQAHYAECLRLWQHLEDDPGVAMVTMNLGHLARARGDDAQARAYYDQALVLF